MGLYKVRVLVYYPFARDSYVEADSLEDAHAEIRRKAIEDRLVDWKYMLECDVEGSGPSAMWVTGVTDENGVDDNSYYELDDFCEFADPICNSVDEAYPTFRDYDDACRRNKEKLSKDVSSKDVSLARLRGGQLPKEAE